jgi:hypothetical protein
MSATQVELDTVLTVAIGRNGADGQPMSDPQWSRFQTETASRIQGNGAKVVCHALSVAAVGSDGSNDGQDEESAVFVAINPTDELELRRQLGTLLARFGQSSACFSLDHFHEPVFAGTTDGYRPRVAPIDDPFAEGRARRTHQ